MKTHPEELTCEACGASAVRQILQHSTKTRHNYCDLHAPQIPIDQRSGISLARYRLPPGNSFSQGFAAPRGSAEHESLRIDMCESQLLGGEGACRYYLSALTGHDHFALWYDEFLANLHEFVTENTNGAAKAFAFTPGVETCIHSFVKNIHFAAQPLNSQPVSKEDAAIALLLNNPDWADDLIAAHVPTTVKQLERFSTFSYLKKFRVS